jgi:hypothetical protein
MMKHIIDIAATYTELHQLLLVFYYNPTGLKECTAAARNP